MQPVHVLGAVQKNPLTSLLSSSLTPAPQIILPLVPYVRVAVSSQNTSEFELRLVQSTFAPSLPLNKLSCCPHSTECPDNGCKMENKILLMRKIL